MISMFKVKLNNTERCQYKDAYVAPNVYVLRIPWPICAVVDL